MGTTCQRETIDKKIGVDNMKKEMYHIHSSNLYDDIWKEGAIIDNTKPDFINTFYHYVLQDNLYVDTPDGEQYLGTMLDKIIRILGTGKRDSISTEVLIQVLEDARGFLSNSRIVKRELALEEIRKLYYPDRPSRKNCIWLCTERELSHWLDYITRGGKVFQVLADGTFFAASDSLLPNGIKGYQDCLEASHAYWNPSQDIMLADDLEYLFYGELEVVKQLDEEEIKFLLSKQKRKTR